MLKILLIALLLPGNIKNDNDDTKFSNIVVKTGRSYKVDLENETYTVYFMNGTSYNCKFSLSENERIDISKMAQECGLASLKGKTTVEDKCQMFPKVYTEISFYNDNNNVQLSIDAGCDKHSLSNRREAEGILKFLKYLQEKISSKPEVAKAPKSDVRYM